MNHLVTALLLTLLLAPLSATAGDQHTPESLQFDCHGLQRPSQRNVSEALGIHNFSSAYAARERVFHLAQRECKRGVDQVVVALTPHARHPISVRKAGATRESIAQAR